MNARIWDFITSRFPSRSSPGFFCRAGQYDLIPILDAEVYKLQIIIKDDDSFDNKQLLFRFPAGKIFNLPLYFTQL